MGNNSQIILWKTVHIVVLYNFGIVMSVYLHERSFYEECESGITRFIQKNLNIASPGMERVNSAN